MRYYAQSNLVLCHWILGAPEKAQQEIREVTGHAERLTMPVASAAAFRMASLASILLRDWHNAREHVEMAIKYGREVSILEPYCEICLGCILANTGQLEAARGYFVKGFAAALKGGWGWHIPWLRTFQARTHGDLAEFDRAIVLVSDPRRMAEEQGSVWAEGLIRLAEGDILAQQGRTDDSADAVSPALTIGSNKSAKSVELRAATSLARLWQSPGKRQQAHDLLAPLYDWFTEGFDTADLIDAKALLAALK